MDACVKNNQTPQELARETMSELTAWFSVSGDMDDFIYYDDGEKQHSEK